MLRYPKVSTAELKAALPKLEQVDPQILSRIDIEGAFRVIVIPTALIGFFFHSSFFQAVTVHICDGKKLTCGFSWRMRVLF